MFSLENKITLITGGANGIGAALVRAFVNEGVKFVAILDVDDTSGTALEKDIGKTYPGITKFYKCDVSKDEELFPIYNEIVNKFGAIDIVVNNAAIANDTLDTFKRQIEINFSALVSSTLKALDLMRVDRGGNGGTIINISSTTALMQWSPSPFVYAATKSAVLHFSNCIGKEPYYKYTKVRVLTMCIGVTDTEILDTLESYDDIITKELRKIKDIYKAQGTLQSTETVAEGIVHAIKNGESGSTWLVNRHKTKNVTEDVRSGYNIMYTNVNT